MDTSHIEIDFDADGCCNFCRGYNQNVADKKPTSALAEQVLSRSLDKIRGDGVGREYDCVLGLSGGVDSSFLALRCKDWGLRVLPVQFDNGWNSELANFNIQCVCNTLGYDLYTHVVDWPEFRDLQRAFLKAGLANLEGPSDHGIFACIYKVAMEKNVKWVLTGVNSSTESCCPVGAQTSKLFSYGYRYADLYHLKAIHRRFGSRPLRTFPTIGFFRKFWIEKARIRRFDPLNWMTFNKGQAISEIKERLGWRPYPGKHFESVITRFHQNYILPRKFGLDKRRLHLSGLIWSGQLSRLDALRELDLPACDPQLLLQDKLFFIKKMQLTEAELESIIQKEPHDYSEYPNINWLYIGFPRLIRLLRKFVPYRSVFR